VSLLGGRREVQACRPIRQVKFSLGSSSQREFSSANFYVWKSFCEVGLSQLLCIDWLLVWNVVSSEAGLSSLTRLWSRHLGMCIRGPSVLYPKQSLKQSLAAQRLRAPHITGFIVMDYPPLLLSDKHQLITSFVSCSALDTSVEKYLSPSLSFDLHLTSPARPSITGALRQSELLTFVEIPF